MKSTVIPSILALVSSICAIAEESPSLRSPASLQQAIICTIGDGKAGSQAKTISKPLIKASSPSIDQEIGDYRIMAHWIPQANVLTIGVIEKFSGTTASTYINESSGNGSLFVSKNHQSVDLNCHIGVQNLATPQLSTPSSAKSQTQPGVQ